MTRVLLRPRGSLLIAALMLFTLLLALGLGLMSSQSARMRAARSQTEAIQAKELCLAAWQDVRVKLGTDILFPPPGTQESFAYSEDVLDGEGNFFGTYTVMMDIRYEEYTRDTDQLAIPSKGNLAQGIYLITCVGKVGERGFEPRAERTMYYEIDMTTFNVIRIDDRGSL